MLKPEPHLRWLGIDMRPRWRRRISVVATYLAFAAAIAFADGSGWAHPYIAMIALTVAVACTGVFSNRGPVKSFEVPPPNTASKYILVTGLDELARYRYGVAGYDAASDEQQSDLLQTYHVGTRLYPRKPSVDEQFGLSEEYWVDEREKQERVDSERWAKRWLLILMASSTGRYIGHNKPVQPFEVVADLLSLGILAMTLAPARILWTEPDPRDVLQEIEVVPREA